MDTISAIKKAKIVPVIKIEDTQTVIPLMSALKNGGINIAEITYRTSVAKEAIDIAVNSFPDMIVGAGSVATMEQAKEAVALGVKFLVSPGFDEDIALYCKEKALPYFGGCVTPTEIMKAVNLGQNIVKFFPAEIMGGLKAIKALSQPFSGVEFMPTGGININNIKEYLSFPRVIACGGSWMVDASLISTKNFEKITALCREVVKVIKDMEA